MAWPMTSNLPIDPIEYFKPEFVNRIDEIVRFRSLEQADLGAIVDIQVKRLQKLLEDRKITLKPDGTPSGTEPLDVD